MTIMCYKYGQFADLLLIMLHCLSGCPEIGPNPY